jgi:hypothetical protein
MSDAQLFQYANLTALLCWLALVLQPQRVVGLLRIVIPSAFALIYCWALASAPSNPDGGFASLAQVKALFTNDRAVLAGWIHYLAFDLFIGCWEVLDARDRGISHWLVVPCLLLTFMLGPVGLLLYFGLRLTQGRRHASPPA